MIKALGADGITELNTLAENPVPNKTFLFFCSFGLIFFEVRAKDLPELKDAIKEETDLGEESYSLHYKFNGKKCVIKSMRSFEAFTSSKPNAGD